MSGAIINRMHSATTNHLFTKYDKLVYTNQDTNSSTSNKATHYLDIGCIMARCKKYLPSLLFTGQILYPKSWENTFEMKTKVIDRQGD